LLNRAAHHLTHERHEELFYNCWEGLKYDLNPFYHL
jgi:hypothetical protein